MKIFQKVLQVPTGINLLGQGFLAAVFLLFSFTAVFSLAALKLDIEKANKVLFLSRRVMLVAVGLSAAALFLLTVAFLTDDFSTAVVGLYSSVALPFFYKLSAVWAGSAGSLLLWSVALFILFGLWLTNIQTDDLKFNAIALSIGSAVCLGFCSLLVFVEKPFACSPVTIDDGAGLNPLLQNFWNVIHPPLLFVGYSAFLIPFVIVSASILAGRTRLSEMSAQLRRWLLFGICFLSLGIVTGARWSYIELGWGGYWAWDPVENASLLPWLLAVAALHSLVGTHYAERFKLWTVVLAPLPFILCLVATFITRSGILASVHSFGPNVIFSALLIFIACCFLLWLICVIRAAGSFSISPSPPSLFSLDKSRILLWTNIILVLTAAVIGTATFWPVIGRLIAGSNSHFTLTRSFYDRVISVLGILLAFLVGLASRTDFRKRSSFVLQLLSCCAAGLICFGLVRSFTRIAPVAWLACGICAFSFVAVLTRLVLKLKNAGKIAGQIAHLGLLLLVVAVCFSSNEQTIQTLLAKHETISLGKYELTCDSFVHKSLDGITKAGPKIIVRKNNWQRELWPHNNLYPNGQSSAEVAVHSGIFEDIYLSFDGLTQDGRVQITAKLKPLMLWLWFAAILIITGSALAIPAGKKAKK